MKTNVLLIIGIAVVLLTSGCLSQQSQCPEGDRVSAGDTVNVSYTGTLNDGTVFDQGFYEFTVGGGEAIDGFDEAVVGMCVGEQKHVTIPPEKAYPYNESLVRPMLPIEFSVKKTFEVTPESFSDKFGENATVGKTYTDATLIFPVKVVSTSENITLTRPVIVGDVYSEGGWWNVTVTAVNDTEITAERDPVEGQLINLGILGIRTVRVNDTWIMADFNPLVAGLTLNFDIKVLDILGKQ